jgi:hypothetical protein
MVISFRLVGLELEEISFGEGKRNDWNAVILDRDAGLNARRSKLSYPSD